MSNGKSNGIKHDQDKNRLDLIPPSAILAIGEVMTYGARKYGENNWQGVEAKRYYAAALRHLMAWRRGEGQDRESGIPHLKHALCNLAFLVEMGEEK